MRVARQHGTDQRPEQIARDRVLVAGGDPRPCPLCDGMTLAGGLCTDCSDRARPHQPGDPYDDLGGEN